MKTDKKYKELVVKAEEYLAGWKRAQADYQNLKKEHSEQIQKIGDISIMGFADKLLPIIDHFELAMAHIPKDQEKQEWVQGFSHIKKQFDEMLSELSIKRIKTKAEQFNANLHEAVAQEDSEKEKDEILEELQAGYAVNGTVIRPAKVIVSK
jgi:molecular chaperone GrpE